MEELLRQLFGYLHDMWRFRWWGLALAWVVGISGGVAVYLIPDRYQSSARIYVDTQSVLRPLMSGLAIQPNVNQQIAVLSRTLITRPNVEKLISMADLDLGVNTPEQREALIARVTSGVKIMGTGRDNLFTLAYQDREPDRAQRVVQALVSLFVESGLVGKRQDTDSARRFIEEQIKVYEQKLSDAENRMKDFRLRHLTTLGDGGRDYVGQMGEMMGRLNQARLELREAENSRDALQRQLSGEEAVLLPGYSGGSQISVPEIDARIASLQQNLDSLLLRYTEGHPDVIGARRVIAELEAQKRKEIESHQGEGAAPPAPVNVNPVYQQMKLALADSEARVASLRARVAEYESRVQKLRAQVELRPQIDAELAQLNRDYDVHKRNYDALVARRESAAMSMEMGAQSGIADFRLIDPPSLPTKPSAPNRLLLMPMVGLGAIGAGLLFALLISQLRPAFSSGRALREATGLPVLGTVSLVADPRRLRRERRGLWAFAGGVGGLACAIAAMTVTVHLLQG